jgi:type IV secretion system protein VirB10
VSSSPGSPTSGAGAVQAAKKTSSGVYDQHLVRKETSPYELLTGSVIPAILTTGINSNLPGEITAVVNQPVYNTVNGAYVLIPAGSKLVGTYANKIIANQDRLAVGWQRVLFPNGTYINLGAMPGASAAGYSGFHDLTDDHTWTMVKGALLMSLVDVGTAIASPVSSYSGGGNMALSSGEQGLAQSLGTAEANLLQKDMSIAPTLKIRQGYTFEVVVTKDMIFPGPYKSTIQTQSNTAKNQVAPATMLNPYNK